MMKLRLNCLHWAVYTDADQLSATLHVGVSMTLLLLLLLCCSWPKQAVCTASACCSSTQIAAATHPPPSSPADKSPLCRLLLLLPLLQVMPSAKSACTMQLPATCLHMLLLLLLIHCCMQAGPLQLLHVLLLGLLIYNAASTASSLVTLWQPLHLPKSCHAATPAAAASAVS
jgi:hypothetical protein